MKISKKILAIFLSVIMVLSFVSMSVFAEDTVPEETSSVTEYDLSDASADVLIDLSDKILSAGDTLSVTIKLTTNFYVTNIQLPVIFDKTQFEIIGKVTNISYCTFADTFGNKNYRFGGRADREQGFGFTSDDEKWNTEEAKAKYGYAYITASYDSSVGNDDETYAKPQNEVFVSFELKALVDVANALESVFISSDWAKTKENKQGLLVVGMTTGETYDPNAESIPYANITYATNTVKHYYDAVTVEPTCTEKGYTKYSCTECEYYYVGDYTDALGHTKMSAVEENVTEADCENDGSYDSVVYCKVCGEEVSRETIVIPSFGHYEDRAVTENKIQPDCLNSGSYDTVVYCLVCGDEISRVTTTVEALGHTEGESVIENNVNPDCENEGSYDTVVYCTVCDEELSRETITVDALGHKYETETTSPTCTEKGYTTYTCSVCSDSYIADYVDALGHTEVIDESKDATCTETGLTEGKHCEVCGEVLVEQESIDALGHTDGEIEIENNVNPDCVNAGSYDNVVYCTVCNAELSRETITVDALGHKYGTEITSPTCTEKGYTTYTCATCGDTYVADYVDAFGHKDLPAVEENRTESDCVTAGSYDSVVYCEVCGVEISRTEVEIPATGHTEGETATENNIEPDCENAGSYDNVVYCTVCNAEISRETITVDALGHEYGTETTSPTCTEKGYTTYTCTTCGDTYEDDYVDAPGHTEVIDEAKDATCTETGLTEGKHCEVCGEVLVEQESVAALGHTEGEVVVENNVAPDCENTGSYDNVVYCTVCNAEISRETITVDTLGHNYKSVVTQPDCTEKGYTTFTCEICGDTYVSEETAPFGHTDGVAVKENIIPATANKDGSYDSVVYCSVCGEELSRETIIVEAYGHDPAEPVEENRVDATCTENGSYDYVIYCVCCDEKTELARETIIIPAYGHTEVINEAVEPDCTNTGLTEGKYCSVCGETIIVQEEIPAYGHAYEAVVTPPTQTEQGYTTYTCSVCGDTYVDNYTDPVIGFAIGGKVTSFGSETDVVTITLTLKGENVPAYTTTVSGNSANYTFSGVVSGEYILTVSKLNHVNRTYDVIVNEENVTSDVKIHLRGDINGDGRVNTVDVARANAHAKGTTMLSGYEFSCADINAENRVNTIDVARMNAHAKGTASLW